VDSKDVHWMRRALDEARQGLGRVEPNPLVGAVVVYDDNLVGAGHHQWFGGPHAEVLALQQAADSARGATLYVTLEPCCHFGKTPPCTQAILAAGIARVVAAMHDPYPEVNGGGLAILQSAGLTVEVGIEERAARLLNGPYLKRLTTGLPFVTAKWAMTLDGKTAVAAGDSRWISSDSARRLVHQFRGRMDAILVGIGSVLVDDPQLTARPPGPRCPVRIILDSGARLPLSSQLARTAKEVPVLLAVTERADPDRRETLARLGCEVLSFPGSGRVPILPLIQEFARRGMTNLLVEGGGQVLGSFLDAGQVDAVDVFIAPVLEGGDHPRTAVRGQGRSLMSQSARLHDIEVTQIDDNIRIQGWLPQPWCTQAGIHDD
jgi:diaminohydroxyphosphoribosylaminopyrimidine deaminase/5-amino-6-(5-phosphoribosylamino)uracil reductase